MDRHRAQPDLALLINAPSPVSPERERKLPPLMPTEEMRKAKAWLERIATPPQPDDELLAIHGWLEPEGRLYACGWEKHNELTKALGFGHESEVEAAGYCKLSALAWLVGPKYCQKGLTEAQWATIERWYARNGFPEEHFLRLCGSA